MHNKILIAYSLQSSSEFGRIYYKWEDNTESSYNTYKKKIVADVMSGSDILQFW
jgi:hypothetical protein